MGGAGLAAAVRPALAGCAGRTGGPRLETGRIKTLGKFRLAKCVYEAEQEKKVAKKTSQF